MQQHEIRAVYGAETIRVYQAYHGGIAEEAVRPGTFGPHFSMNRMTWIKPSFLWMMYRCGWAERPCRTMCRTGSSGSPISRHRCGR